MSRQWHTPRSYVRDGYALKASKRQASPKTRSPPSQDGEGGWKTTTSIGRRCTRGDALSQPILIAHRLAVTNFATTSARPPASGTSHPPRDVRLLSRWPWRGRNTRPHPEHGSEGPHRRGYCGVRPWESSTSPGLFPKGAEQTARPPFFVWKLGSLEAWTGLTLRGYYRAGPKGQTFHG